MIFKTHSELKGQHALFSPSQNAWLRYDDDKIAERVRNQYRTALGTEIHEFIASQIELSHKVSSVRSLACGVENYIYTKYKCGEDSKLAAYGMTLLRQVGYLPKSIFETAKYYINDAISYRMAVEQPLVYSEYFFGTADTISFRDNFLRIHDYKSGERPAHMDQVHVYAALFCLEYGMKPKDIDIELRIYQSGDIAACNPDSSDIQDIMNRIISANRIVETMKAKEE